MHVKRIRLMFLKTLRRALNFSYLTVEPNERTPDVSLGLRSFIALGLGLGLLHYAWGCVQFSSILYTISLKTFEKAQDGFELQLTRKIPNGIRNLFVMSVTKTHLLEMEKGAQDPDAAIEFFKNELEKAEKQHDEDFGATMKDYEAKMKVNPKMAEYYEKVKAKLSEECELKKSKGQAAVRREDRADPERASVRTADDEGRRPDARSSRSRAALATSQCAKPRRSRSRAARGT